jgi:serine O-acetyltransferase
VEISPLLSQCATPGEVITARLKLSSGNGAERRYTAVVGLFEKLVYRRKYRLVREFLLLYGVDVPAEVEVGPGLLLNHRALGTVIHPLTTVGRNVTIYHQVTIGRADGHIPWERSPMEGIEIGDNAVLYPGSKILGGRGVTRVGEGTIVAANAVLTQSTGDWEVWGGIPARKIGTRPRDN